MPIKIQSEMGDKKLKKGGGKKEEKKKLGQRPNKLRKRIGIH